MKNCNQCRYYKEEIDHRGYPSHTCTRPGGCDDRETYKAKTPPHDPRMGIYSWDESTWPENWPNR